MLVHVWARPVACPQSQQKAWPHRHNTRLQLRRGGCGVRGLAEQWAEGAQAWRRHGRSSSAQA